VTARGLQERLGISDQARDVVARFGALFTIQLTLAGYLNHTPEMLSLAEITQELQVFFT
jgi:hypothetical protein